MPQVFPYCCLPTKRLKSWLSTETQPGVDLVTYLCNFVNIVGVASPNFFDANVRASVDLPLIYVTGPAKRDR